MDFFTVFVHALIVFWMVRTLIRVRRIEEAAKTEGIDTSIDWRAFWRLLTIKKQIRQAEREWILEQERVRESNQQLRENTHQR